MEKLLSKFTVDLKSLRLSSLNLENSNNLLATSFVVCLIANFLFIFEFQSAPKLKINFNKVNSKQVSVKVMLAPPKVEEIKKVKPIKKASVKKKTKQKPLVKKKKIEKQIFTKKKVTSNQGQNSVLAQYVSRVRDSINSNKDYPMVAKRLKHQGTVKVEIIIDKLGNLTNLKYLSKTNSVFLNGAVEEIFKKVKSFGALPSGIDKQSLKLIIPIVFELI